MPLEDILVHVATPVRKVREAATWVEGESDVDETPGTPFDCCLFLPLGAETPVTEGRGGRNVKRPTLLFELEDQAGAPVALSNEDELLVVAEELNVAAGLAPTTPVRWQVQGSAQPFGKPGEDVIGHQVILRRVED